MKETKPNKFNRPVSFNYRVSIIFVLLLGLIFFGGLAIKSFTVSASSGKANNPQPVLHQSIEYDYRVYPVESILFPAGTEPLPPGRDSFYANLTDRIRFQASASVRASLPVDKTESNLRVELFLRSEGQWNKELLLEPEITVDQPERGLLQYHAVFDLPLSEAARLGEAIQEELQGWTRGEGFSLVIKSTLNTTIPELSNHRKELSGEYEFALEGAMIRPKGELLFEDTVLETETVAAPNHIAFLGFPVNVFTGRILFPFLCLFFTLAAGICYFKLPQSFSNTSGKKLQAVEKVRKFYGSRLIKVATLEITENICRVEVAGYRELAKIADEVEKPILEVISVNNNDPAKQLAAFYVVDGETLYWFKYDFNRS